MRLTLFLWTQHMMATLKQKKVHIEFNICFLVFVILIPNAAHMDSGTPG